MTGDRATTEPAAAPTRGDARRVLRRLEGGMFSKIAWAVIAGMLFLHLASFFFYAHQQTITGARTFAKSLASQAVTVDRLTLESPQLLSRLSGPNLEFARVDTLPDPVAQPWPHTDEVRAPMLEHLAALGYPEPASVRFDVQANRGRPVMTVALPTGDGQWFTATATADARAWESGMGAALWMTVMSLVVLAGVLWGTRRITRRLPGFIAAAEHLGAEQQITPLPEEGPTEIRRLSAAFNQMQQRLKTYVDERSAMLGAVSHDLRTFITRVKLRTDYIADDGQREKAQADLDAITEILDEAVAFARDEQSSEARASVDLASMLASLVDDERDLGNQASYTGPQHLRCIGQPTGLQRAFANLIKNAVRYGGSVEVHASAQGPKALIEVRDPGIGIPPDQHEAVLKPYVRLDPSRNRNSGGAGLGLAITANVLRRHAGTLKFLNRPSGFTVRVLLPTSATNVASVIAPPRTR